MTRAVRALLALPLAALLSGAARQPRPVPPGDVIRVHGLNGDTVVTLIPTPGGGLVRVDLIARLLGGSCDSTTGGGWRLSFYGTQIDLTDGVPFATYQGFPLPLSEETRRIDGAPHASLQLFSEIVPRFGIGILWDRSRSELRLFQAIARRTTGTPPRAGTIEPATPAVATSAPAPNADTAPRRATSAPPPRTAARPGTRPTTGFSRRYTVAVDAGHGGVDPGNKGVIVGGIRANEAKLTLEIALKLEKELIRRGVGVVMTRRKDTLIALAHRGPIANRAEADLFVSIHTNAANPRWKDGERVRGFETYFLSEARTEDEARVAAMENDVVRFEADVEVEKGDPLSFIINDLAQNEHLRESSDLAAIVQGQLGTIHPGSDRGVKQAGFSVLRRAFMPAVLVEVGFGTNAADGAWMASPAGQRQVSVALADAIFEYLQHYERRTRAQQR